MSAKKVLCLFLALALCFSLYTENCSAIFANQSESFPEGNNTSETTGTLNTETKDSVAKEQLARLEEISTSLYPAKDPDNTPSYFTVSGSYCVKGGGHGSCSDGHCRLWEILQKLYDGNPEKFGRAYQLLDEDRYKDGANGYTCFAFRNFVWLYAFEARLWRESDKQTILSNAKPTKENFDKLQPGDAVSYLLNGKYFHAAIFLSCDDSKVTFLDCNWCDKQSDGSYKYNSSIVREREVYYSSLSQYTFTAWRAVTAGSISPIDTVSLDPTYLTIPVGGSFDCTLGGAMETSADHGDLLWTSSDTNIAAVTAGKIEGCAVGEVTITVETAGGSKDTVTINVVDPEYHCAEKWTCTSSKIGARVSASSSAGRAAKYADGHYVVKKGDPMYILSKTTDASGNTWGFGAGYSRFLNQNIWGWFNLIDKKLGSEQFDFSYFPSAPTVTVTAATDGVAKVSWTAAEQATCYHLYQDDILIKAGITQTSAEAAMGFGTTSSFKVEAVNENFPYNNLLKCSAQSSPILLTMQQCSHPVSKQSIIAAVAATCTEAGLTEGVKCSACGEILVEQKVTPALGHTEEIVPGKEPTLTEPGLTEGKKCATCGTLLVEQEELPMLEEISGICGENLTWTLTKDGVLTISGEGAMYDYDWNTAPWYDNRALITSAALENGVMSIGDYAFACCETLETVTYAGTKAHWDEIEIGEGNEPLLSAGFVFEGVLPGDVNSDGKVTGADTNLIFRYVAGMIDLTDEQLKAADVNGDGRVTGADTNLVFRYVSGMLDSLG